MSKKDTSSKKVLSTQDRIDKAIQTIAELSVGLSKKEELLFLYGINTEICDTCLALIGSIYGKD